MAKSVVYCTELDKARARAERAEAEAALMRVALQSLRRRIDDIIQAATKQHEDLYWLDDSVTQIIKADADAALASDAGRALLERVRRLERVAEAGRAAQKAWDDHHRQREIEVVSGELVQFDLVPTEEWLALCSALVALEADDSTPRKEEKHDDNHDEQPGA